MVKKVSIAGNGIVALITAYLIHLNAREANEQVRITMRGTYPVNETTGGFLFPSITENELLSVVPPGKKLLWVLEKKFSDFNGGIRVDSPEGIIESAKEFIQAVEATGSDEDAHCRRTALLTELGRYSVFLWEHIYQSADQKLRKIMEDSNYLPCRERENASLKLRDGYRIDLYFDATNLKQTIESSLAEYTAAGYKNARVLTPDELEILDPGLKDFCKTHSIVQENIRVWKEGTAPVLRPGGCINTAKFLPRFTAYLAEAMGTYVNEDGKTKSNFRMKCGTVSGLKYNEAYDRVIGWSVNDKELTSKRRYESHDYILCPGEAVGTLDKLGVIEPPHARFVGASIQLTLPADKMHQAGLDARYKMNMALRTGVISSVSQAGIDDKGQFFIGVAGMKAFYGLIKPAKEHKYAIDANVYQLNMLNNVYPHFVSWCLGKNTHGLQLNEDSLKQLEANGLIKREVASRAVAFDGVPTVGHGYHKKGKIKNLFVSTHWSSGGVTNAPAAAILLEETRRKAAMTDSANHPNSFFNQKRLNPTQVSELLRVMHPTRRIVSRL